MPRFSFASVLLCLSALATARAQSAPALTGRWVGSLTNLPSRPGAPAVEVEREVGAMPTTDSSCTTFRTTYREKGEVRQVKDYRLCRGAGANDMYVDEGGGVRLAARWLGDVLVSPFKVQALLLVSTIRVRDGVMEEEIFTIQDAPASGDVVPLQARGIQRLLLKRLS